MYIIPLQICSDYLYPQLHVSPDKTADQAGQEDKKAGGRSPCQEWI